MSFLLKTPSSPAPPPAPTIDDATKNRDDLDRIRKRKGVLANIFGGNTPGADSPQVGTKTLLG